MGCDSNRRAYPPTPYRVGFLAPSPDNGRAGKGFRTPRIALNRVLLDESEGTFSRAMLFSLG